MVVAIDARAGRHHEKCLSIRCVFPCWHNHHIYHPRHRKLAHFNPCVSAVQAGKRFPLPIHHKHAAGIAGMKGHALNQWLFQGEPFPRLPTILTLHQPTLGRRGEENMGMIGIHGQIEHLVAGWCIHLGP